jgi:hypothetical protein
MQVQLNVTIPVTSSAEEIQERVRAWATCMAYRLVEEQPGRWLLRRGSRWHALYTFDLHKIPCEVIVLHMPLSRQVACSLHCRSWRTFPTKWDQEMLEDELDLLRLLLGQSEGRHLDQEMLVFWKQKRRKGPGEDRIKGGGSVQSEV